MKNISYHKFVFTIS